MKKYNRKQNILIFLSIIFYFLTASTNATQIESNGVVTISNFINIDEFEEFSKMLKMKKITTVIFQNCYGGNALAAFRYAEKIKENQINTVASKIVASACSFAYLGGKHRTLDNLVDATGIMFHGRFDAITLKSQGVEKNLELLNIYEKNINFKFSPAVKELIIKTRFTSEGVYFTVKKINGSIEKLTLYCDGLSAISLQNCKILDGLTLDSEGIITK